MNAPTVTRDVARRFHQLRRGYLLVRVGIALASAVMLLLLVWIALAGCDYRWEWSLTWRKAGILIGAVAVSIFFAQRIWTAAVDTRQRKFAARIEHSFEAFGQRIRTVLDTVDGRVGGPNEMLAALGHQTLGRWETLSPAQLVPSRRFAVVVTMCVVSMLVAACLLVAGGDLRTSMLRALGNEIPYTRLSVTPGDARLLEGSPVVVSLELRGRTGRDVMLRYRDCGENTESAESDIDQVTRSDAEVRSAWKEIELIPAEPKEGDEPGDRHARFAAELGNATHPIEYRFLTSIGSTRVYRVDVQPLIEAKKVETNVKPPAYTRLKSRTFSTTNLTVLEDSVVTVVIETSHPLSHATLETGEKPSQMREVMIDAGEDRAVWEFGLPSKQSLHWRFTGAGIDGTPMTPLKGRLAVRRDAVPSLTWRDPPDEFRAHTLAELPMRVQVADDYGIDESGIVFQLGSDDEFVLTDWAAAESDDVRITTRLTLEEILPLESFSLSERDYISYYAFAVDNRESGPQRVESDVRYIDIRPLRQFFSELERDPNAGGGRVLVQLDEIIRRQRFLINRTRRLLKSSGVDLADQLGKIDRLVEGQSELAGLTRFLAEFLVARGNDDVEALNQAEAAMLQAADSLAAASFDLSLIQEEDALRALAEARRSLEVFLLKNPTLQQQQELRRLAQQLQQKLRRAEPETDREIADSLQRIASEQSQLGQLASQIHDSQTKPIVGGDADPNAKAPRDTSGAADGEPTPGSPATDLSEEEPADAATGEPSPNKQSDKPSPLLDQREQLHSRQIELLERVLDVGEQLADRLADSPLMARRVQDVTSAIDDLASQTRNEDLSGFAESSDDAAEQLREIGTQLEAIAASEPVSRVSAIRDMTSSLASMEVQLGELLQTGPGSRRSDRESTDQTNSAVARLARRMKRRTETIEEVLKTPAEIGDVETSEVNDFLEQFIEERNFLDQLEQTRDAAEKIAARDTGDVPSEQGGLALQRAVEYAEASQILDELYRELVTPRLARLRGIEQQVNQLNLQVGGGGEMHERDPETRARIRVLQDSLEQQGLDDLAALLSPTETPDEEIQKELETRFGGGNVSSTSLGFDPRSRSKFTARLLLVAAALQERIQEVVLLEISADRDTPVPAQYRRAVDRYFRTLAGEAEPVATDATKPGLPAKPGLPVIQGAKRQ